MSRWEQWLGGKHYIEHNGARHSDHCLWLVGARDDLTYTHDSLSVQLNSKQRLWWDGAGAGRWIDA